MKEAIALLVILGTVASVQSQNFGLSLQSRLGLIPSSIAACYQGDVFYPSNKLPNSLENLIYLVEKVETALLQQNIKANATFLASLLLRRFQLNGISDIQDRDDKSVKRYEAIKQEIVFKLLPNVTITFPDSVLTDKEKCSLHYMLSTSINETIYNDYYSRGFNDQYNVLFPRENGAVYAGLYGTLSAGSLLAGIAASATIVTNLRVRDLLTDDEAADVDQGLDLVIDPVMAVTLAGEIGQSVILFGYPPGTHIVLGPDGNWNGTVCPTTFTLASNQSSAATNSQLLGALDGMIIGSYLRTNYAYTSTVVPLYLSQVLRTYYGRGFQGNNIMSACDRRSQTNQLMPSVSTSAVAFAVLYKAKGGYNSLQEFPDYTSIGPAVQTAVQNFSNVYSDCFPCNVTTYNQDCQVENDIIVVMDTGTSASGYVDGYQEQKNFIGNLITRINVYPNNSHVGIMTYGGGVREPVPFDRDNSGAYIKCTLQWYNLFGGGNTDVAGTIRALQDRFRTIKNKQRIANPAEAPGRVIIFLFQQSNIPNQDDVTNAFRDFRYEHPDVLTLAVGSNRDILSRFVLDTTNDVFVQPGEQLSFAVDKIVQRLCKAPSLVEYGECNSGNNEQSYSADEYIYPDTNKWIAFNQWTFNKSSNLKVYLQTSYGYARICFSRYITNVDPSGMSDCLETSQSTALQVYNFGNPCSDYGSNCRWIYMNARGTTKGAQSLNQCSELACDSPNQIKLTITHVGARCGSLRIVFQGPLLLLCVILTWTFKDSMF